jgi:CubicO group peptidase (beta-lactamase class C family)
MTISVSGDVRPGFEPLIDAFAAAFEGRPRMGAGLCVRLGGEVAADLWAGVADARSGRAWTADTPTVIFSCTKGLVSILAARLAEEGRLAYADPVSRHWPEFAAAGKAGITVGDALAHRAGLSAPRRDLVLADILDWRGMTDGLAVEEPLWAPGTGYAYHAITHGWLNGEVLRRITGESVGRLFARIVAEPLGVDAWIGLPEAETDRPAFIEVSPALSDLWKTEGEKPAPNWPLKAMTLGAALPAELATPDGGFNDPRLRAAEIPAAGGIASARALATIWSATVRRTEGVRLLGADVVAEATVERSAGAPVFAAEPPYCRWGAGFQLDSEARRYLGPTCFGHDGAGGQVGFADPERGIGFGFVTNWMMGPEDGRATAIIEALKRLV